MIVAVILIFLVLSFFESQNMSKLKKSACFIFCLVLWWFLESFRWESGTDFYNYYNNFNGLKINDIKADRFELGYNLLVLFCRDYLHFTFYVYNSVYYAAIFVLYYFSIRKATQNPILFLCIFFCLAIGLMGSSRQLMALSIMFFATVYFLDKKKIWFILFILLASFFHRTIIICLLFIFFNNSIRYTYWLFIIISAFLLQINGLTSVVLEKIIIFLPKSFSERLDGYMLLPSEGTNIKTFLFGIFRRILPIIFFFIYKEKIITFWKRDNIYYILNILLLSLFAYILLSFKFTFIISRISIYFIIFEILFYSMLIPIFVKEGKYIHTISLVLFFLVLSFRSIAMYPYLFLPYKTIFFTL